MGKKTRSVLRKPKKNERGQALIPVLLFLLLGSLLVTSLLSYMSTGLRTGQVYREKTDELYAADAGVEDSIWQIKYDYLNMLFPTYDDYDYTSNWAYILPEPVNDQRVNVTIENTWIPKNLTAPNKIQARNIISAGKLIVTGSIPATSTYQIKIYYYRDEADDPLMIETLGIWLPAGFTYVTGSSNLEADVNDDYYWVPVVSPHAGGQAVVWNFSSYPFAGSDNPVIDPFPGVNPLDSPISSTITFQFTSTQPNRNPEAVSWITTSGVSDIPFSWDADTSIYRITSIAGDTEVEAYTVKSELRELGSAIAGDYRAVGNTLMIDRFFDFGGPKRDTLLTDSEAVIDDIPSDAKVIAAYLYWSGWFKESAVRTLFWDDCSDFRNWNNPGNVWKISSGRFVGQYHGSAPEWHRFLTLQSSLDLSMYQGERVTVSWEQSESGRLEDTDCLYFNLSSDGGNTWSSNIEAFCDDNPQSIFSYAIPDVYLTHSFQIRFYLANYDDNNKYCYIDNIAISYTELTADKTAFIKINGDQVYFDANGLPRKGAMEITADRSQVIDNLNYGNPHGYSYSCFKDVTALVNTFADEGYYGNRPGNAHYTVGGVDADWDADDEWAYAGWSLIIIYSSPQTKGHQLYLYDDFLYCDHDSNLDFDRDGEPGGTISGFLVPKTASGEQHAAKLTCFVGEGDDYYDGDSVLVNGTSLSNTQSPWNNVWNSRSPGLTADGVDVDTFHITWDSDLLTPGDTSAHVSLTTKVDIWNLVYIILSFRSEATCPGILAYQIE